jgi:hypothetical protein
MREILSVSYDNLNATSLNTQCSVDLSKSGRDFYEQLRNRSRHFPKIGKRDCHLNFSLSSIIKNFGSEFADDRKEVPFTSILFGLDEPKFQKEIKVEDSVFVMLTSEGESVMEGEAQFASYNGFTVMPFNKLMYIFNPHIQYDRPYEHFVNGKIFVPEIQIKSKA